MLIKILSILGIILLCLLALLVVTLLLVLFWPVSYRGGGSARAGEYRAWFRFRWLFGLVRGGYAYPESGGPQVKVLWLTVYGGAGKREKGNLENTPERKRQSGQTGAKRERQSSERVSAEPEEQKLSEHAAAESEGRTFPEQATAEANGQTPSRRDAEADGDVEVMAEDVTEARGEVPSEPAAGASSDSGEQTKTEHNQPLPKKLSGLKEKLQFYLEIVRDEDNQGLVKHGLIRLGRILKSIRPRLLRAEALVGVGEPDLTGYVYGAYWAVKPFLGKKCQVAVTPDFDRRILEGEITLGGRIMAVVLIHHVIRVLLDKRLRQLMGQLKNM